MVKRILIALSIVLAPAAAVAGWQALLSPGPVGTAHEKTESNCDSCHLVFKGIPDEKCLDCHKDLDRRIDASIGYHAKVATTACIECHADHQGRTASLTLASVLDKFTHDDTQFALRGRHDGIECAQCHAKPLREMGSLCSKCHEDVHEGELGDRCEKCHGDTSWKKVRKSVAEHAVAMHGGHAERTCTDCHVTGRSLTKEVRCATCHERGHDGTNAPCDNCHQVAGWKPAKFDHTYCTCKFPGKHRTTSCTNCHVDFDFTNTPTLCSGCHAKQATHEFLGECSLCHSALSWKDNRFDHNEKSKFTLADLHLTVDCDRCHFQKRGKRTQFKAAPEDCAGCHRDEGMKAHGDFGACEQCHDEKGFKTPRFNHASTGFLIDGQHVEVGCQDCHSEKTRGFERGAQNCAHCHEDVHSGQAKAACETCHTTADWSPPALFTVERHAKTKFPLVGKHTSAECSDCHVSGQLQGLPSECAGCHLDVHQKKFGTDCESCHTNDGFAPVTKFDHQLTGFALVGQHAQTKCEGCHEGANSERMNQAENRQACQNCHVPTHAEGLGVCRDCHDESRPFDDTFDHRGTGFDLVRRHAALKCAKCHPAGQVAPPLDRCGTCHVEPHSGQLGVQCERCHEPDRWSLVRFDHDVSGWPLRGRHFVTPCMDCHTNERWVGLTTECFDCHALDAARGRAVAPGAHPFGRIDCTDCHFSGFSWR